MLATRIRFRVAAFAEGHPLKTGVDPHPPLIARIYALRVSGF